MLRSAVLALAISAVLPSYAACPAESTLANLREKGVETSRPLTVLEVEALTETAPRGMSGFRPYAPENPDWRELKAKQRIGDYFIQFWPSEALLARTKFYMDGLYLVRDGCVIGWLKGAVS